MESHLGHSAVSSEAALAWILLGAGVDLLNLALSVAYDRRGRGPSGIPLIPLLIYWGAVLLGPHPLLLYPSASGPLQMILGKALDLVGLSVFHLVCNYGIVVALWEERHRPRS